MNEHYTYGAGDSLLRARVNGVAVNGSRAA
jgi:hypothetical protein